MRFLSVISSFKTWAAAAIVLIGSTPALTISGQAGRFVQVDAVVDGQEEADGLSHVVSMAFAGDQIYLSSRRDNCLTVLARSVGGNLKAMEVIAREATTAPAGARTIPSVQAPSVGGGTAHLTKDGRFCFLGSHRCILLFERGDGGQLTLRGYHGESDEVNPSAGYSPLEVSPDERFLFTSRLRDGLIEVVAFDRDPKAMSHVQEVTGLGRCEALAISPDGRHLYAASPTNELLYVFSIDADSGKLTKLKQITAADCGLGTLANVSAVEMSPDGSFLVVTSVRRTGEVSILKRDSDSGNLTPFQLLTAEKIGSKDLNYPVCAAYTADGMTLFLGCRESYCVVVLRKEDESGPFTYLETIRHPTVDRPTCLAVDQGFLFVCSGEQAGAVSVFRITDKATKPKLEDAQEGRR